MKRLLIHTTLASLALACTAGSVFAHGGQFRGPGGAVDPRLREPTDPTPPTPPKPSGGPPVTPPPTNTPGGSAPPAGPVTPMPLGPVMTARSAAR